VKTGHFHFAENRTFSFCLDRATYFFYLKTADVYPGLFIKLITGTEDRVFERFFFADIQIGHMKIKRQKPRREERPRMSENTLSSVQPKIFVNNPG
jgi:hypothetical protein